ncbi:hypothetical protein C4580_05715 [Candidatus Woesearchaeota archaeon]|nr:MAG: hypothetical protein C4580_05715 [Candidatus Woesearchaeota archaeon]
MALEDKIKQDPKHWLKLIRNSTVEIVNKLRAKNPDANQQEVIDKIAQAAGITPEFSQEDLATLTSEQEEHLYDNVNSVVDFLSQNPKGNDADYQTIKPLITQEVAEQIATISKDWVTYIEAAFNDGKRFPAVQGPSRRRTDIAALLQYAVRHPDQAKEDLKQGTHPWTQADVDHYWKFIKDLRAQEPSKKAKEYQRRAQLATEFAGQLPSYIENGEIAADDVKKYGKLGQAAKKAVALHMDVFTALSELRQEHTDLETEHQATLRAQAEISANNQTLTERVTELGEQLGTANRRGDTLNAELAAQRELYQHVANNLAAYFEAGQLTDDEKAKLGILAEPLAQLIRQYAERGTAIETLERDKTALREQKAELAEQLEDKTRAYDNVVADKARVAEQLETKNKDYATLAGERDALRGALADRAEAYDAAVAEKDRLAGELERQSDYETRKTESETLRSQNPPYDAVKADLDAKTAELAEKADYAAIKTERTQLKEAFDYSKQSLRDLAARVDKALGEQQ